MNVIHRFAFLLALSCTVAATLYAQPFDIDAQKQGLKGRVHWVKRTWYHPKPGTTEPDQSKIPDIYMRPNQLIEYNEAGKLRAVMDYKGGTNEESGPTERWYYTDGRLTKHAQENANYDAVYIVNYTYDAAGHETKRETRPGPGDKMGFVTNETTESVWSGGNVVKMVRRAGAGSTPYETSYTYDAAGRVTRETYAPAGLYSARTYEYDSKGHLIKDTYLDKDGKPSTIWTLTNNAAGKPTKRVMEHFYNGKKDGEETTTYTYNTQGDLTAQKVVKDSKTTYDYAWQHTYDAKGNRIQTVHIKTGVPEVVEVLELRYY